MSYETVPIGAEVMHGGRRYTVKLVSGDMAAIEHKDGGALIVRKSALKMLTANSDGWFTVRGISGFAYYIHWDVTTGMPVYQWGLAFTSGQIEAFPQPFGLNHQTRPFDLGDYRPVKLVAMNR